MAWLRRLGAALALALAACAKQQPLPVANFVGITDRHCVTNAIGVVTCRDAITAGTGQQIVLDGSNSVDTSDPCGAKLSFDWSFVSLPTGSKAKLESIQRHHAPDRWTVTLAASTDGDLSRSLTEWRALP